MTMICKIFLTHGRFCIVNQEDFDFLNQWHWRLNDQGYAIREETKNGKTKYFRMHRVIIDAPKDFDVDHINQDRLDNRRINLRLCTRSQNTRNGISHSDSTSKFRGVYWNKKIKRWIAQINHKHIGSFVSEIHAAMAHDIWAKEKHKDFASLNFKII